MIIQMRCEIKKVIHLNPDKQNTVKLPNIDTEK